MSLFKFAAKSQTTNPITIHWAGSTALLLQAAILATAPGAQASDLSGYICNNLETQRDASGACAAGTTLRVIVCQEGGDQTHSYRKCVRNDLIARFELPLAATMDAPAPPPVPEVVRPTEALPPTATADVSEIANVNAGTPLKTPAPPAMARPTADRRLDCALPPATPTPSQTITATSCPSPRPVYCDMSLAADAPPSKHVCGDGRVTENVEQAYQRCITLLKSPWDVSPSGTVFMDGQHQGAAGTFSLTPAGATFFHPCSSTANQNQRFTFPQSEAPNSVRLRGEHFASSRWGNSHTSHQVACPGSRVENAEANQVFVEAIVQALNVPDLENDRAHSNYPKGYWNRRRASMDACQSILAHYPTDTVAQNRIRPALATALQRVNQVLAPAANSAPSSARSATTHK